MKATTAAAKKTLSGASWLPAIAPHLAACIVEPSVLAQLQPLCQHLPSSALYALEMRLGARSSQVDLSCRIDQVQWAHGLASEALAGRSRQFLLRWADTDSELLQQISEVWLEYDFPVSRLGQPTTQHQPLLCLRLASSSSREKVIRLLSEQMSWPSTLGLDKYLDGIEPPLRLLYLFDLAPRGLPGVRFEIFSEVLQPLVAYVGRHMSQQDADRVAGLGPLLGDADRLHLSFDVLQEGVSPRLGLEASYRRLPHREPRWFGLLDRLQETGLCTDGERRGIERWPGVDKVGHGALWPPGARGFLVRCLSHVKVVTVPEAPCHAKVYLLFQNVPATRAASRTNLSS